MGLVGSVGFGLWVPLGDSELMSFMEEGICMSSTCRVLIGFRAADAFVCCLIEGGLISFVGFFLWGLGYVCCFFFWKLDLELMSSMEC